MKITEEEKWIKTNRDNINKMLDGLSAGELEDVNDMIEEYIHRN